MKTNVLGFPRIGEKRELKKASENYWKGIGSVDDLLATGSLIKHKNWLFQKESGIDLIPSNDFSFYDQMLDMSLTLGCIPRRFSEVKNSKSKLDLYFAMARGIQKDGFDIKAMEMTKWFDTNYHYIVPEFDRDQTFKLFSSKIVDEYKEALALGIKTKPVLIGPITYLLLGKEKEAGFHRLELLDKLFPVYFELLAQLQEQGVEHIQFDEPCLALNLNQKAQKAIDKAYREIAEKFPELKIIIANYFECYGENLKTALALPVHALHLDLVRCQLQLDDILEAEYINKELTLSLGVVDGRNIWKNDFENTLHTIKKAVDVLGADKVWVASSCSFLHCPYNLDLENNAQSLPNEVKEWLAFTKQKVAELVTLKKLANETISEALAEKLRANQLANSNRRNSKLVHDQKVKLRMEGVTAEHAQRLSGFTARQREQKKALGLPLFPTTTIGSFPQTKEVRQWRSKFKRNELTKEEYDFLLCKETEETIRFQEEIGVDVLVHGEFERNDMVEYFGEKLEGFAFTSFGWVQSYGSRCVKPPIIFGDISRTAPMTVKWSAYAQSLTPNPVKGMLTGPVTILQWSFVRNDQPRSATCQQIALAIRDEVSDLENAGLKIIQIDEPAIREGLPLRKENWDTYLNWAVTSFKIASSSVKDSTQIHTHMCYAEFNDIIGSIADLDADVITIETSRSEMELLDVFVDFKYPNEIGPGVYDIHSPRVPSTKEMKALLVKASELLPIEHIWVNPDCGLKTRDWPETKTALVNLVETAKIMREGVAVY
ncbi:5-methyltetrahydropteroyltriglutamate--homocysteine S-methyltransferase [uncultured Kriegella sp.]|uniref:5-methyltetrahydropteroyltriglutamate-- homocysteine S-methyltransferase n=1 Tax=uncultured Kriegella sp. TaxID=1798910 RepID=UPI0030D938ED|tara:strand:- start:272268 stop:274583 length:2316 start_codon:yes stop_codon:yes gene_type:complete